MRFLCFLTLFVFLLESCKQEKHFDKDIYSEIATRFKIDQNKIYIYRFIGDCSFCYSQVLNLDKTRSNKVPLIVIVDRNNIDIVTYKIKQLGIATFIMPYNDNFKILELNKIYLVNKENVYIINP